MKYYVHHTPGRLRIRIPSIRNNPVKADHVKSLLNVGGTEKIKVNPMTGSVVATYDPDAVSGQHLLRILKENGFYSEDRTITIDDQLQQASYTAAHKFRRAFFSWAVGRVLEANGLSLIAALI
jgi:copper chaperone CopZ